jgi:hypothetical protein
MGQQIGIWIDSSRAVIATLGRADVVTVTSGVEAHTRFKGSGGHPGSHSSQTGAGEKRSEAIHDQALERFYDEVVTHVEAPEAILVFGPGETKLHLKGRLEQGRWKEPPRIDVEAADKLTDPQIVAHVAQHFGRHPVRLLPRT